MKPCGHATYDASCRICYLSVNDSRYAAVWGTAASRSPLVECIHRGEPTGELVACLEGCKGAKLKVFNCSVHGKCTVAKYGEGIAATCRTCNDKKAGLQIAESRATMHKWAYGVTSCAERVDTLLPKTLLSLAHAGFDKPRVFIDGCKDSAAIAISLAQRSPMLVGIEVSCHYPAMKTVGNWVAGLWELLVRNPTADRFAMFQDDLVICKDVRRYLDASHWPAKGYLNLLTFPSNQGVAPRSPAGRGAGWFEARECYNGPLYHGKVGQKGLGAVALCFTREAVLDILSSRHVVERPLDAVWATKKLDGMVVTAMNQLGWREYCHDPSLVQHTGEVSSIGNRPHPLAPSFRGEQWSAMEVL